MKKILFVALSLLFLFACKNPQNDGGKPSDKKEEFAVNFSVKDNVGGTLTAKVKDGDAITTGKKVAKDKEVVFTATPTDSTYSVESWTLDGNPVAETELKLEKKEYTLKITKSVNVVVKFKKNGSNPNPTPDEEFAVNFSVKDNVGGTLTAKVKDGDAITTGRKVVKDKEVVFTATPTDSTYSVESWTLDGNPVAETELKLEKKEYTLKITKSVNVIVKFKKEGAPSLKDIQIDKIILGYPHISPRDGKTVLGKDLNGETTIEDFEVPAAKFPIQVHHKSEFTVEQAFVTFDGGSKEELTNPVGRTIFMKEYSLVQDKKTSVIIDITGEGYKPLKLTFNVTYKKATKKYVDDLTMISVIKNKGGATEIYGAAGKPIVNLKGGQTIIEVTRNDPTMTIFVRKAEGQQAKAEIKLDGEVMAGKDFATGQTKLEVKFDPLSAGKHHIEIKLEKPDYETANYDFYINYKPFLTFKSLTINGKTYNSLDQIKQIALKADDKNPVDISGEVNELGATVYFKRVEGGKWVKFTPPLDLEAGKNLPLTMNAELDGYTTTPFLFRLKREKLIEPIVITKIEVDGNEVAKGAALKFQKQKQRSILLLP